MPEDGQAGTYLDVLRNRVFVAVLALNFVFIAAAMAQFEKLFPVYAKNEAGLSEKGIGVIWFVNTVVIVLAQLPIARALEGRRHALLALLGVTWAVALALIPVAATTLGGTAAFALFFVSFSVFAVGECLHGTVQAPLVVDLADHRLIGRYMALSAFSWSVGFTVGPAIGAFVLKHAPDAWWLAAAAACLLAGAGARWRSSAPCREQSAARARLVPPCLLRASGRRMTGRRAHEGFAVRCRTLCLRRSTIPRSPMPSLPRIRRTRPRGGVDVARAEPRVYELSANGLTWVYLETVDADMVAGLAERFGWHELDLEDVLSKRRRPRSTSTPTTCSSSSTSLPTTRRSSASTPPSSTSSWGPTTSSRCPTSSCCPGLAPVRALS